MTDQKCPDCGSKLYRRYKIWKMECINCDYTTDMVLDKCPRCKKGEMYPSRTCGVDVCTVCGHHSGGLARCFCGWNLHPGEILEDDIEYEHARMAGQF